MQYGSIGWSVGAVLGYALATQGVYSGCAWPCGIVIGAWLPCKLCMFLKRAARKRSHVHSMSNQMNGLVNVQCFLATLGERAYVCIMHLALLSSPARVIHTAYIIRGSQTYKTVQNGPNFASTFKSQRNPNRTQIGHNSIPRPGQKRVIAMIGDGSFQCTAQEVFQILDREHQILLFPIGLAPIRTKYHFSSEHISSLPRVFPGDRPRP
jgi:hypothetical protein